MAANKKLPGNNKNFGATPPAQVSRSTFNLSKNWKGTFDAGQLIPFFVSEGLPGDTRKIRVSAICRMATPIKPLFDNIYLDFHFWWVPCRQLWDNFTKMMGEQENPGDTIDYLAPQLSINSTGGEGKTLADNMGLIPPESIQVELGYFVASMPFRAYARIYNYHYRDQNLIDSVVQDTDDGPDTLSDYPVRRRGKRHDYLTASLPFQQKGDPVSIDLGGSAPIFTDVEAGFVGIGLGENATQWRTLDPAPVSLSHTTGTNGSATMFADLGSATGISITELRQSIAMQHVLERDARSGSRYPEILLSRFRVMDPQMLVLQRPEYLGGGTKSITITPVPQTTPTDIVPDVSPQGNLAATGTAMVDGIGFTRSFTEHGYIMGIVSARADLTYQQGVERMWNRRARFDWFHPELAHLSEQAVLQKEIYVTGNVEQDDATWGFIGAYDDYRYGQSLITGKFRSSDPDSLEIWHASQYFANSPTLNQTFIEENPPIDRLVATPDEPQFLMDAFISDIAARPIPISGIPGLSRI